jgi:phosphoribosylformylglycinamidine synthase
MARPALLRKYNIVAVPGGFSYGDDTGSGKAYGTRLRENLGTELTTFLQRDTLLIGICNGFQILTHAGLLPGALVHNDSHTYQCRWVDVQVRGESPWLRGINTLSIPIAHGEGKYVDTDKNLKALLARTNEAVLKYIPGPMSKNYNLPYNPNGALYDIAGVTSHSGRVLGLMPHPERGFFFTHRPDWTLLREQLEAEGKKLPEHNDGQKIFSNAIKYFS